MLIYEPDKKLSIAKNIRNAHRVANCTGMIVHFKTPWGDIMSIVRDTDPSDSVESYYTNAPKAR